MESRRTRQGSDDAARLGVRGGSSESGAMSSSFLCTECERVSKGYAEKSEAPTDDGLDYNHSTAPLEKVMVVKLGLWQSTVIVHVLVAFGARRS